MKVRYYLHDNYDFSEIKEVVKKQLPHLTDAQIEQVAEQIQHCFYEVACDIELNPDLTIKSLHTNAEINP